MPTSNETFHTGRDCDAWCTKCKMDLAHTIVAMVRGLPVQVKCNTCHSFHRYRAPKSGGSGKPGGRSAAAAPSRRRSGEAAVAKAARARQATVSKAQLRWEELVAPRVAGEGSVQRYDVRGEYGKGDLVDHPTFGVGVVLDELPASKIRALFRDSERILVTRYGTREA